MLEYKQWEKNADNISLDLISSKKDFSKVLDLTSKFKTIQSSVKILRAWVVLGAIIHTSPFFSFRL